MIEHVAKSKSIEASEVRRTLSRKIASIELFPYHSKKCGLSADKIIRLKSAQLAKQFVHDDLLPKAKKKECLLIVTRQVRAWDLPEYESIIAYSPGEARGAHLTVNTRGGEAIANYVLANFSKWQKNN